jgi:Na+-transporting methylmalonyl-CoA/oxaloacetate decarboxylase gamma subunit
MNALLHLPVAAAPAGFPWLNLFYVLAGITALLLAIAGLGRWLAATHPEPVVRPRSRPAPAVAPAGGAAAELTPEVAAAIAAAVHATLGASASIHSVVLQTTPPVSVENLMLTWSLEGRRQIYTSHKVR